eukprot:CAMPEP_0206445826 /NCGR_PEP_ID=MMETSP0324_2-20121206/15757_1 /ASSEMBLY_ACC=CAM_ASM_000836 /TAXON_ID=2866 /ORGANISM="Crypthecodinium cohnii, Strain Seligo" /LENGTH=466 /DNA_ID=CAMNT_0053914151 /DNA_START=13 /DNA_END=1410 /DNA_ORIENTATION=+
MATVGHPSESYSNHQKMHSTPCSTADSSEVPERMERRFQALEQHIEVIQAQADALQCQLQKEATRSAGLAEALKRSVAETSSLRKTQQISMEILEATLEVLAGFASQTNGTNPNQSVNGSWAGTLLAANNSNNSSNNNSNSNLNNSSSNANEALEAQRKLLSDLRADLAESDTQGLGSCLRGSPTHWGSGEDLDTTRPALSPNAARRAEAEAAANKQARGQPSRQASSQGSVTLLGRVQSATSLQVGEDPAKALAAALTKERRFSTPAGGSASLRNGAEAGGASGEAHGSSSLTAAPGSTSPPAQQENVCATAIGSALGRPPLDRSSFRRMASEDTLPRRHSVGDSYMREIQDLREKNLALREENLEMRDKMLKQHGSTESSTPSTPQPVPARAIRPAGQVAPVPTTAILSPSMSVHRMVSSGSIVRPQRVLSGGPSPKSPQVTHRLQPRTLVATTVQAPQAWVVN